MTKLLDSNKYYLKSRYFSLFRVFFPSWRFFQEVAYVPMVHVKVFTTDFREQEWQPLITKLQRSALRLFYNPRANLTLAYQSLLEQVVQDINDFENKDMDKFQFTNSYQLVNNLVQFKLREFVDFNQIVKYQFKIRLIKQGDERDVHDVLISPIINLVS